MEGTWVCEEQLCFFMPEQAFPIFPPRPVRPNIAAASGVCQPRRIPFVHKEQKGPGEDLFSPNLGVALSPPDA